MKSAKYINYVVKRKCFLDFFEAMGNYADPKEWSEVVGVLRFTSKIIGNFRPQIVIDAGCGVRPTLGVWAALNNKSFGSIFCVDPNVSFDYAKKINGLMIVNQSLGKVGKILANAENCLLIANHAHIKKDEILSVLNGFKKWVYVTCPCCVDNTLDRVGAYYKDPHIHSPKNKIYGYSNFK